MLESSIASTAGNTGMVLNLALSYGGRDEIIRAARKLATLCQKDDFSPEDISEETFANYLYSSGLPDPDLLIRTGGESRLSNFLLWQASYAEILITDTHWPDFGKEDLIAAIVNYQQRQRRFGKTGDQVIKGN